MNRDHSRWINLAMIAALLCVAVAAHQLSPLILPRADLTALPEAGCDLNRGACAAVLPQGRIELSITPRPVPFLQPLHVEVASSGLRPTRIEVDFAGATMNMGYNRAELTPRGAGRYAGEFALPVCVTGVMTWVATVIVETDRQRIVVPYRFDVGH